MKPFFIISHPRARGSVLERILNATPGVTCHGETSGLIERMRALDGYRAAPSDELTNWRRGTVAGSEEDWHASLRMMLQSWTGTADFVGIRDSFTGREEWSVAVDAWTWLQTVWPDAPIIFLHRDREETEISMVMTSPLWIPEYGECHGCCFTRVGKHTRSMSDYHELRPDSTALLNSGDLLDFEALSATLLRLGLPIDLPAWEAATAEIRGDWRTQGKALEKYKGKVAALPPADVFEAPAIAREEEGIIYQDVEIELTTPVKVPKVCPWPAVFRLAQPAAAPTSPPPFVFTLRWGETDWLQECAPTLDDWCERHGYPLKVVSEFPADLPAEKFIYVDLLREFLASAAERALFIDADVFVHPSAPAIPLDAPGVHCRADFQSTANKWGPWVIKHFAGEVHPDHVYRQAGVWACDRAAAEMILAEADSGPFVSGYMEQHQWNLWLARAAMKGMPLNDLPLEWNTMPGGEKEKDSAAWFVHLAGNKKELKLASYRGRRLLPERPEPFKERAAPAVPRAIVYPWLSTRAAWRELEYSLRSVMLHFKDQECPIYILGDRAPAFLAEFPRAKFVRAKRYVKALEMGLQIADEILWMNDDIFLLKPVGWEDFDAALRLGRITQRVAKHYMSNERTRWRRGLGRAAVDLMHLGVEKVYDYSTHTPYRYERTKAIETLRVFGPWWKVPFETLYHNMHGTPAVPCGKRVTRSLPADPDALFLNVGNPELSPELRARIVAMFDMVAVE